MNRSRTKLAVGAVALAAALALASCSAPTTPDVAPTTEADPHSPEVTDITGAIFRQTAGVPFAIAATTTGPEYGLELTPAFIDSSAASVAQLVAGDVQFAYSSYAGAISANQGGVELRIVAEQLISAANVQTLEALPDSGIEGLEDLEGKKVAVASLNSTNDGKIIFDMLKQGLDPSTVEFVELPFGEVAAALQNGTIDAGTVVGPALVQAKDTLNTTTVYDYGSGEWEGFAEAGWIVTADFAEANPNTVAAFQCAIAAASEAATDDQDAYEAALTEFGFTPEQIAGTTKPNFGGEPRLDALAKVAEVLSAASGSEPFDIPSIVLAFPDNC